MFVSSEVLLCESLVVIELSLICYAIIFFCYNTNYIVINTCLTSLYIRNLSQ